MEGRAGANGRLRSQSTCRTQRRESVIQEAPRPRRRASRRNASKVRRSSDRRQEPCALARLHGSVRGAPGNRRPYRDDQSPLADDRDNIERQINVARQRVDVLEERLGQEDIEERIYTFINLIADHMTEYAATLDLEHAERRIRLDLRKLSVVAETVKGPIPLNRIGSGENWVGYHVVTMLALHRWFRQQERPVPGFLIFDQPSQAHYPPDFKGGGVVGAARDADTRAVRTLFEFMHHASQGIGTGFQLIVLDHALFDDEWFIDDIVEDWRDPDSGLIPIEWTTM